MAHHQAPQNDNCTPCEEDGCADAFASVAVIAVIVSAVVFWLSGMA